MRLLSALALLASPVSATTFQWQHASDPEPITVSVNEEGRVSFLKSGDFVSKKYNKCAWTTGGLDPLHDLACPGGSMVSVENFPADHSVEGSLVPSPYYLPSAAADYPPSVYGSALYGKGYGSYWPAFDYHTINWTTNHVTHVANHTESSTPAVPLPSSMVLMLSFLSFVLCKWRNK